MHTLILLWLVSLPALMHAAHNGIPIQGTPSIGNQEPDDSSSSAPSPSEAYPYREQLDSNYQLHWRFNDTHIWFEAIVKTNGWVGLGISPQGSMLDSDVVIGWVSDDGKSHFADRHTTGQFLPAVDESQDWRLLEAREVGEYTILKMMRRLETCDENDLPILEGTTRIIFAHNAIDPTDTNSITQHESQNRGTKSVLLLDPPADETEGITFPPDTKTFDFVKENHQVRFRNTEYHCSFYKIPDLGQKHHMIRFDPIIQPGNEKIVHHMVLYFCRGYFDENDVGLDFNCFTGARVNSDCENMMAVWAIGGKAFDFPSNAGYSLGTDQDPQYFMLEVHYDNPDRRSDIVDSSGLRLYLTTELRQHDAGTLDAGMPVSRYQVIPPGYPSFLSTGYCTEGCLSEALGDKQEIRIFATMLHSHLLGTRLRTRHIRNGVELPKIAEDNNYDFDYQETRMLLEEAIVRKGDTIMVECELNSSEKSGFTYGGVSTEEEMCLAFIYYYPRIPLSRCVSAPIGGTYNMDTTDFAVESNRIQFQNLVNDADITAFCTGYSNHQKVISKPTISTPLVEPPSVCDGNLPDNDSGSTSSNGEDTDNSSNTNSDDDSSVDSSDSNSNSQDEDAVRENCQPGDTACDDGAESVIQNWGLIHLVFLAILHVAVL